MAARVQPLCETAVFVVPGATGNGQARGPARYLVLHFLAQPPAPGDYLGGRRFREQQAQPRRSGRLKQKFLGHPEHDRHPGLRPEGPYRSGGPRAGPPPRWPVSGLSHPGEAALMFSARGASGPVTRSLDGPLPPSPGRVHLRRRGGRPGHLQLPEQVVEMVLRALSRRTGRAQTDGPDRV